MKRFHFKPGSRAARVEVSNGHLSRTFERDKEPFDVTPQEARLLAGVEDLEEVPASQPGGEGREEHHDGNEGSTREESADEDGGGAGEEEHRGDGQD